MTSLLPAHRPDVEKAIELSAAVTLKNLPVGNININPMLCDEKVLEVLAYSYNLDISSLDINQARALVSKAFLIGRHKGTYYAVKEAVKALFPKGVLIDSEEPYLFKVALPFEGNEQLTPESYNALKEAVNMAKNARSHLAGVDINLRPSKADIYAGAVLIQTVQLNQELEFACEAPIESNGKVIFRI